MKMLENDDKKVFPRTGFEPATSRCHRFYSFGFGTTESSGDKKIGVDTRVQGNLEFLGAQQEK